MGTLVQVVNGDGEFNKDQVEEFITEYKLSDVGKDYQVVAIMGPQSSGKSTLMNNLFGTGFVEMDAMRGRSQTTKGIWLAKSPKINEISTLVMDLEGSDGRERGEDDTNFERQSALFALAVADILMVNVWCHDIGREQGSGKPLLKTIFQVNLKLFAPEPNRKKSVLLFVLRDRTKTPLPKLVEVLQTDLDKMWETITKPPLYTDSKLTDFFEVQFTALANFEMCQEEFKAETVFLRRRFNPSDENTLVRPNDKLPGGAFALSVMSIWQVIKSQKDLNLPAHKIMVATIRCEEIKNQQLQAFKADQAWENLATSAGAKLVPGFNKFASALVDSCTKGYEQEAMYFDLKVKEEKGAELNSKLAAIVGAACAQQIAMLHTATGSAFEKDVKVALSDSPQSFAQAVSSLRQAALDNYLEKFKEDIAIPGICDDEEGERLAMGAVLDAISNRIKKAKIDAAVVQVDRQLSTLISGPVINLLDNFPPGLWPKLHSTCKDALGAAEKLLEKALEGYGLDGAERSALLADLQSRADKKLENHVHEASLTRLSRMRDRFQENFTLDEHKNPRMWSSRDNIPVIATQARLAAANVLAQLAVMRPDNAPPGPDAVEAAVLSLARSDMQEAGSSSSADLSASLSAAGVGGVSDVDVQSISCWPDVPPERVLLEPHTVRTTWREFMSTSNVVVQQALSQQQTNRMAAKQNAPLWALAAIMFLGWNEMMTVLFNPFYLILIVLTLLFVRTLYVELDVDVEMQRGVLPGSLSIASKIGPAMQSVLGRTFEVAQALVHNPNDAYLQTKHIIEAARERAKEAFEREMASGSNRTTTSAASSGTSTAHNIQMTQVTQRRRHEGDGEEASSPAPPHHPMEESRKDI